MYGWKCIPTREFYFSSLVISIINQNIHVIPLQTEKQSFVYFVGISAEKMGKCFLISTNNILLLIGAIFRPATTATVSCCCSWGRWSRRCCRCIVLNFFWGKVMVFFIPSTFTLPPHSFFLLCRKRRKNADSFFFLFPFFFSLSSLFLCFLWFQPVFSSYQLFHLSLTDRIT